MEAEETWQPVPGFEQSHAVSNLGRVRITYVSILKTHLSNRDYPRVTLSARGRKRADPSVHALVAAAFLGPRPPGHQIHHKDGDKMNPRLENLEYVSPKEHGVLTAAQGRIPRGAQHCRAKLTEEDVRAIRATRCTRDSTDRQWARLAARYGVSIHTIRSIRERSSWKHLP